MRNPAEIKEAADRSVRAMQTRPSIAQYTYKNRAKVSDGLACSCEEGKWTLDLDVPASIGGEHSAPSPGVFARSAMSACVAIGVKITACREEIPIDDVTVDLEVDADNRADFGVDEVPPGFQRFRLTVNVTSPADPAIVEAVVNRSLSYSPLVALHRDPQDLAISVSVFGSGAAAAE